MNEKTRFKITLTRLGGKVKKSIWKDAISSEEALNQAFQDKEVIEYLAGSDALYSTSVLNEKTLVNENLSIKWEQRN